MDEHDHEHDHEEDDEGDEGDFLAEAELATRVAQAAGARGLGPGAQSSAMQARPPA